ncbi:MAG: phospholipase [Bacteroidetes bacterium]|uniref:Phospholipase n=1 Tax=Phaeocystidibacter marisrubri TaxID=1577780 RepID=A0A6L3ZF99_9FLAO|nr:phospholipase [Phaeocystidibacter marisrubri]KAB2816541.1 phospholipase [Phaeocystidibacter marisrubri]TNE30984.1 MAG: phospholipase [Bacteroidota bacterium]GGH69577.1 esterase [Phaeocystidibacter marisrubri]
MEEHSFKVEKTTRFFSSGGSGDSVKELWIVLHGYGQLPQFFLRKFSFLETERRRIVAPEGLHRFYLQGTEGRVGASWMTKEARLDDIADQAHHLDRLLEIQRELCPNIERIVLFGFSQGVSTACRWMDHRLGADIDALICWAGSFPPDIDYNLRKEAFVGRPFHYFWGDNDPYLSEGKVDLMLTELGKRGIHPTPHPYKGEHSVDPEVLAKVWQDVVL